MTIEVDDRRKEYPGNGVANSFAGPRAFSASHIRVYEVDTATQVAVLQVGNYTLTGVGGRGRTTVTANVAPAVGKIYLILRTVPYEQDTDITNQGRYLPEVLEGMGDKLGMQVQQLADGIQRSLRVADTVVGFSAEITNPTPLGPVVVNAAGNGFEAGSTTLTGDMLLRGNLADANVGPLLVAYKAAGGGAVARTLLDKLRDADITPEDYGAVGDGVTNDYAALVAAMTAAAASRTKVVKLTANYAIGTTLLVPQGVRLVGRGNMFFAWNGYTLSTGSIIKWIGATGGGAKAVRFFAHNYGGGGLENVTIDSNNKADIGLELDGCVGLDFKNVGSFSCLATADIVLTATTNPGVGNTAITCSWNTFTNCYIGTASNGKTCLWMTGVGATNACHNTFINLHIDHAGTRHGLVLGNCDNNTFVDLMITRGTGTGAGVRCDPTEQANFPSTNVFYHLQAGAGGWVQPNTTVIAPAMVWDYQLDNGQPYPVLNGTLLNYSTNFGLMTSELPRAVGGVGNPAFLGTWVNYGAPAANAYFLKDRQGYVHLSGVVKSGVIPGGVFTLPVGYRPLAEEYYAVCSNGAFGWLIVKPTGEVIAQTGNAAFVALSGVTFRADYPQS